MISVLKPPNWIPPPSILLTTITLLVFPEAWVRRVIPSGSQVPEDSVRIDPESKAHTTIHSSVPLPGSVIDYSEEVQEHSSCVIEDTPEEGKQYFVPQVFRMRVYFVVFHKRADWYPITICSLTEAELHKHYSPYCIISADIAWIWMNVNMD